MATLQSFLNDAPALVSAVVALVAAGSARLMLPVDLHPLLDAIVVAGAFAVIYASALRLLFRRPLAEIVGELPHAPRLTRLLRLA